MKRMLFFCLLALATPLRPESSGFVQNIPHPLPGFSKIQVFYRATDEIAYNADKDTIVTLSSDEEAALQTASTPFKPGKTEPSLLKHKGLLRLAQAVFWGFNKKLYLFLPSQAEPFSIHYTWHPLGGKLNIGGASPELPLVITNLVTQLVSTQTISLASCLRGAAYAAGVAGALYFAPSTVRRAQDYLEERHEHRFIGKIAAECARIMPGHLKDSANTVVIPIASPQEFTHDECEGYVLEAIQLAHVSTKKRAIFIVEATTLPLFSQATCSGRPCSTCSEDGATRTQRLLDSILRINTALAAHNAELIVIPSYKYLWGAFRMMQSLGEALKSSRDTTNTLNPTKDVDLSFENLRISVTDYSPLRGLEASTIQLRKCAEETLNGLFEQTNFRGEKYISNGLRALFNRTVIT